MHECSCLLTCLFLSHIHSISRQMSKGVTWVLIKVEWKLDEETGMNGKKGIQVVW